MGALDHLSRAVEGGHRLWVGARRSYPSGRAVPILSVEGQTRSARRVVLGYVGPAHVHPACGVDLCVAPDHLALVRGGARRGRV